MAKKATKKKQEAKTLGTYQRNFVVRDDAVRSPVLCDFSTLVVAQDMATHSLYQTQFPLGDMPPSGELDQVLVGRYAYTPEQFKALVPLFMRTYVATQAGDKKEEAITWLRRLLDQLK